MSSIHWHPTRTSLCLQPPRAIRTIHSFMPAFSASTMPMSFALVVIHNTMKSGLNFYGLDGTNTKAQMCNGVTQNWTRFPILPSPRKVHLDSLTPTMCYVHAISYLSSQTKFGDNQNSFQWEITDLQYWAYLNRGGNLDSTRKEGQPGIISMGNFNRKSQKITGLQYWAYFNGGLNLREAGFNRKRRVARTHFNRKFHIYNIWPTSMGEI